MRLRVHTTEKNALILTFTEQEALRLQLADWAESREARLMFPEKDSPLHELMRALTTALLAEGRHD